ncbi:MAG TPA: hypothetical protein VHT73_15385, partial [Thermodesulfobacteriota bacterium]|nr:hypothetical protein [Thermodesulfobacteriota bacterium]
LVVEGKLLKNKIIELGLNLDKDLLRDKQKKEKEKMAGIFLGTFISNYITNPNIQEVAKRAAWLGNDETHYLRIWTDKDVHDLKLLIQLTVRWIETEELTKEAVKEMPEGKKCK